MAPPRLFPGVSGKVAYLWASLSAAREFSLPRAPPEMLPQVEKVAPSRAPQWEINRDDHDLRAATW
jgi:hypothetical protein